MKNSRQKNAVLNVSAVIGTSLLSTICSFIIRSIIIKKLGIEILGLDGLFTSVISVLSLADLGVNTAVIFSLYEPISKNDHKKINAYIRLIQKIYVCVGLFFLGAGCLLIPVLPYIVNLPEKVNNLYLIYLLTLGNVSISYFFASRKVLLEADQRNRIIVLISTIINIASQFLQAEIIILFKDYVFVLVIRMISTMLSNIIIFSYGNKLYPYIKKYGKEELSGLEKKELVTNTVAVFFHRVGTVFVTGTDQLIISTFINTIISGIYSNYLIIINSLMGFITVAFNAFIASVGDLKVSDNDNQKHYNIFKEIYVINFAISFLSAVLLYSLLDGFISIWVGTEFLLDKVTVIALCINFYVTAMRLGIGVFTTAAGYFKNTLAIPIIESVINSVVSIVLVIKIGLVGVFVGSFTSILFGSFWVSPYITFKKWFNKPLKEYYIRYIIYFVYTFISAIIVKYVLNTFIHGNDFGCFILSSVIALVLSLVLLVAMLMVLPEGKKLFQRVKLIIRHN